MEGIYDGAIFNRRSSSKKTYEIFPDEVQVLNSENYRELSEVPTETIEFWKHAIKNNRPVLWFPYITHIFLKGRIDTSKFETCTILCED